MIRQLIIDPDSGQLPAQKVYPAGSDTAQFWQAWQDLRWTDQFGG